MESSDPFKNSSVFVDDFSLLEVKLITGVLSRHFDKRLVSKGGMVKIFFEFEQSFYRSSKELRMTQSVSYVSIFLLRFDGDVVLVAFAVVVMICDGSVEPFLFPFDDMLELALGVPGSISNESIFVLESPLRLVHDISARETEVRKLLFGWPVFVEVGVDTWDSIFIWSIKLCDGSPYLSLHLKIIFQVVDDFVVLVDFSLIVILVKFACYVMWGAGVLMRKCRIGFIVHDSVFFDLPKVGLFLL